MCAFVTGMVRTQASHGRSILKWKAGLPHHLPISNHDRLMFSTLAHVDFLPLISTRAVKTITYKPLTNNAVKKEYE
jgi:hypothetical protein